MMKKISIILLTLLVLLTSCTSNRTVRPVYLTNEKAISLLDLDCVGEPIDYYQLMTGTFNGKERFTAEVLLQANEEILALVMMSTTGQTIAEISYDGLMTEFDSSFISVNAFKAEYILADIQLAFYDEKEVEKELYESDLIFEYGNDSEGEYRQIYDGEELIWRCTSKGNHVSVINYLRNYTYEMENL